jgi:signal transduction histidine kinase/tetratricopeptide (TPR) repeat protein
MLDNLKLVLLQHKKFLAIFFVVVFLPSVVLAFFGIRAIHNERYKLQQQNLEQQKGFARAVQTGIQSHIERNSSKLKELSAHKVFSKKDYRGIHDLISDHLKDESLFGHIVIWNLNESPWLLGFQTSPPDTKTLAVPEEWKKWRPDLEIAERAEFRRRNFSEAVSLYKRILDSAEDSQVKAWMLSRIARCEIKREKFKQALNAYRSIIADFSDLLTESGRPLELVSRMEMLDAFRLDKNHESFFRESLNTYGLLEQNNWSLDGEQIKMYATILKNMIDEVVSENPTKDIPSEYAAAVEDIQNTIDKKLKIWQMAGVVRRKVLPQSRKKLDNIDRVSLLVQKSTVQFENNDVLVLFVPLNKGDSGQYYEFLGSFFRIGDMAKTIDAFVTENCPQGASVLLHSTLSDKIIYGKKNAAVGSPIITAFFPENFPPWKLEVYQDEDGGSGFSLYKNIFFWTILALLFILFFGSGLIIRTIIQEVNLLNLKSEFIASVSHEFKTPLTSMGAILEHLMDDKVKDPDKTQEYYRILSHDSERLKRLVKNVLDFTKIEEGKRKYKRESIDIVRLVQQEVESFEKENRSNRFKVGVEIGANIPPVYADEEAMSQVLHNILDNAAKFSDQEKKIDVEVVRKENNVEIAVRDKGIGIPESEQKKIFGKFYRGKQASAVSPTGTGLGLTLVRHIMEAHGGDVVIQSRPREGTCVSLILPINKGE